MNCKWDPSMHFKALIYAFPENTVSANTFLLLPRPPMKRKNNTRRKTDSHSIYTTCVYYFRTDTATGQ